MKRGQSQIIATVLLILMVVVAIGIISSVLIPYVRDKFSSGNCLELVNKFEIGNNPLYTCYEIGGDDGGDDNGGGDSDDDCNPDETYINGQCVSGTLVSDCITISESGNYILKNDINADLGSTDNCIYITANYVLLDLKDYSIKSQTSGNGRGIKIDGDNAIIKNGNINDFSIGIYLDKNLNNKLLNLNFDWNFDYTSDPVGISLSGSSNNLIKDISIQNSRNGILLNIVGEDVSENNEFYNIISNNNKNNGISIYSSNDNIFSHITANNNNNNGFYISNSNNNKINNSQACDNTNNDLQCNIGTGNFGDENIFSNVVMCNNWPSVDDYEECCVPKTCVQLGFDCGIQTDNCGNQINCGGCLSGYHCEYGNCVSDGDSNDITSNDILPSLNPNSPAPSPSPSDSDVLHIQIKIKDINDKISGFKLDFGNGITREITEIPESNTAKVYDFNLNEKPDSIDLYVIDKNGKMCSTKDTLSEVVECGV